MVGGDNNETVPTRQHDHFRRILSLTGRELKEHAPFTIIGAFTGILLLVIIMVSGVLEEVHSVDETIFFILHPTHIFLSAWVTTSLYLKYGEKKLWVAIIIGFTGALGIATLSDSVIPFISELLLQLPHAHAHIGFIEEPVITITPAIIGIIMGYFVNATKFPHLGHVLISTWASLFHVIMALGASILWWQIAGIFFFLFIAVWLPCCLSDIIYPMLFMKKVENIEECVICAHH
jgi:hypothetical protein